MTNERDIIDWARKHKSDLVAQMLGSFRVEPSVEPVGIFMAGLPGSGKTEFTKSLMKILDLKAVRLDMDEVAARIDGYAPEKADRFRAGASILLSRLFDEVIKNKYDFIMDGTFGGNAAAKNVERALKHGYRVRIFYIVQDPKVSWQYTVARELVEFRAIEKDGFVETYYKIFDNLAELNRRLGQRSVLDLIIKDKDNRIKEWVGLTTIDYIDGHVEKIYNKDKLRKYISE